MRVFSIEPAAEEPNIWLIIGIAAGVAVVFAVVLFFLIKFVFIPNKMKREILSKTG